MLAVYPYDVQPDMQAHQRARRRDRHAAALYPRRLVRLHRLAAAALRQAAEAAEDFPGAAKRRSVDIDGNIKKFLAQRAGFQKSGVSQNNRLIERHSSRTGYFWTSYDFGGNKGKQSLFEHPLGPRRRATASSMTAARSIFSLPNGFQAYYLNNAKGEAARQGPDQHRARPVAQGPRGHQRHLLHGLPRPGHPQGQGRDPRRRADRPDLPEGGPGAVEALYPPTEEMDRVIEDDAKRFGAAMVRAGLEPDAQAQRRRDDQRPLQALRGRCRRLSSRRPNSA